MFVLCDKNTTYGFIVVYLISGQREVWWENAATTHCGTARAALSFANGLIEGISRATDGKYHTTPILTDAFKDALEEEQQQYVVCDMAGSLVSKERFTKKEAYIYASLYSSIKHDAAQVILASSLEEKEEEKTV